MSAAEIGDNIGDGAELLRHEIEQFLDDCAKHGADGVEITPQNESLFAELVRREVKIRKTAEANKDAEKRPYLDLCNEIQSRFNETVDKLSAALASPAAKLKAYTLKKDAERQAREKAAREKAEVAERERLAAIAVVDTTDDPFERFRAADSVSAIEITAAEARRDADVVASEKTKVAAYTGRAVGLKTVTDVVVDDYEALVLHLHDNVDVKEAAYKAACRLAKAAKFKTPIPGVRFVERKELS